LSDVQQAKAEQAKAGSRDIATEEWLVVVDRAKPIVRHAAFTGVQNSAAGIPLAKRSYGDWRTTMDEGFEESVADPKPRTLAATGRPTVVQLTAAGVPLAQQASPLTAGGAGRHHRRSNRPNRARWPCSSPVWYAQRQAPASGVGPTVLISAAGIPIAVQADERGYRLRFARQGRITEQDEVDEGDGAEV
jgi:hypothetical protein